MDVSASLNLENWVIWKKGFFEDLFYSEIERIKRDTPAEDQAEIVHEIDSIEVLGDIADCAKEFSIGAARQIMKKLPFDRLSYLIEYEQNLSSQSIITNRIWQNSIESALYQWFIARDIYSYIFRNHINKRNKAKANAVGSIITRSLLVYREILCLCTNGFPDGAMARWRTLHELYISLCVLNKLGKNSWELFLVSERLNRLRYAQALPDVSLKVKEKYEEDVYQLRQKFGLPISDDYGWAAISLGRKRVNIRDLENFVDYKVQRANVKHASFLIHANHLWPSQFLGCPAWNSSAAPIVGPSPYGIELPLLEAARIITLLSIEMMPKNITLDLMILLQVANLNRLHLENNIKKSKRLLGKYTEAIKSEWHVDDAVHG